MKKVFVLIFFALAIVCLVDVFFNFVFRRSSWGVYKKMHQIFEEKSYYDIWIVGSSRSETAFETNVIFKKTNLKCFNAGTRGSMPQQTYCILKHIIRTHPIPKMVVFDIDVHNMESESGILSIEQFIPFLYIPSLRKDFSKTDKRVLYAYYFPVYEISFYGLRGISKFVRTIADYPGKYDTAFQITGCYHSYAEYPKDQVSDSTHVFKFHPTNLAYLDSAIYLCEEKKINLLFTISPIYMPDENISDAVSKIKGYFIKRKVKYMDFSCIPSISYHQNNFSDKYHLNFNGSVAFTNIFCDSLKKYRELKIYMSK